MTLRARGLLTAVLLAAALGSATVRAETLEMKDGSKVVGTVVEETDSAITLKVKFGTIVYQKSEIKNIEKEGDIPAPPPKKEVAKPADPPAPPPAAVAKPEAKVEPPKPKTEVAAPAKPKAPEPPPAPAAPAKPKPVESEAVAAAPKTPPSSSSSSTTSSSRSNAHEEGGGDSRDVIVLKAGGEQKGFLVSESDTEVVFDVVMSGKSVAKTMLSRTTFRRAEVDSIKKLTDEQCAAALKDLNNAASEAKKDKVAEQNMDIEPYSWPSTNPNKSIQARRIQLDYFNIESDVEDELLRKLAFRLDKVFKAYKSHFGVDRNEEVKVRVVIFNSMEGYYASINNSVKNPAYYSPDQKLISAGCDVKKYETLVAEIREHHKKLENELSDWKVRASQARADVRAQVSRALDKINATGQGNSAEGQAAKENVKQQECEWMLDVAQKEKHVTEIQDLIFSLNRRNDVVFSEVTQQMLSTMYHEGFHAFLDNFLFTDTEQRQAVPRWLNEGLAQYFEAARLENGRFILGQDVREKLAILRKFRNDGALIPLEKLVKGDAADYMVHEISNLERSTKNYLQAWLLTNLLGDKGRLKKEILQAYVAELGKSKTPIDALPVLSGMPNDQLEQALEDKLKPGFQAAPDK